MTTVKQAILKTYLQLLHDYSPTEISVKQIVETANISRSSFYVHFAHKDAVWDELRTTLIHEFLTLYRIKQNYQQIDAQIVRTCKHILIRRNFYKIIFKDAVELDYLANSLQKYLSKVFKNPDYAIFASYGTIGYLKSWIINDFQISPADAAEELLKIGFTDWTLPVKKEIELNSIIS